MNRFKKIFNYLLISFVIILVLLTVVAKLSENKITDFVTEKISESITAPITIQDASFTLIRRFPLATIEFNGVTLGSQLIAADSARNIVSSDTLAHMDKLFISVRSKELFHRKLEIVKIEIDGTQLNYLVDTAGNSNFDFLLNDEPTKESDTTEAAPYIMALNQLLLKNIHGVYLDDKLDASANIHIPEIEISGIINPKSIAGKVEGNLLVSECRVKETPVNKMEQAEFILDLEYLNDSIFVHDFNVLTDGASLNITGVVYSKDKMPGRLAITGTNFEIKKLLKYAPTAMLEEKGIGELDGELNLTAHIQGELLDSIAPEVRGTFNFQDGTVRYRNYPRMTGISMDGRAGNGFLRNNSTTQVAITHLHLETIESSGDLSFTLQNLDQLKYKVESKFSLSLEEFTPFVPDSLVDYINGEIILDVNTEGEIPETIDSTFADYLLASTQVRLQSKNVNIGQASGFKMDSLNCLLTYRPNNIIITNLDFLLPDQKLRLRSGSIDADFKGEISNPESLQLYLYTLDLKTAASAFKLTALINNPKHPMFELNSQMDISLNEFSHMLPDSLITSIDGGVRLNVKSHGTIDLDSISNQVIPIAFHTSNCDLYFNNISLDMPDTIMNVKNLSGGIQLEEGVVKISKLHGEYMNIPWAIDSTSIQNIYTAYFLKTEDTLKVDTRLALGDVNYAAFAPLLLTDTVEAIAPDTSESNRENFDLKYEIKGKLNINSVTYHNALMQNITAKYNIKNSLYIVDDLVFEGFEGSASSSIRYTKSEDSTSSVNIRNNINAMNIRQLLYDFDNFHQTDITHENISGLITSEVHSEIEMIGFSIVPDKIRLKGAFTIENGGIYDYEPLRDLPKFTSLDELDKIEFKTFKTNVFILKSSLFVPETYISSTAFDISAFGMQKFNDDYEYHLQLHPKDFLMRKSKKLMKEQARLGEEAGEDTRSNIEIITEKVNGKSKAPRFDTKDSRKLMALKIRTQESFLKLNFYEKIVNYQTGVK